MPLQKRVSEWYIGHRVGAGPIFNICRKFRQFHHLLSLANYHTNFLSCVKDCIVLFFFSAVAGLGKSLSSKIFHAYSITVAVRSKKRLM